MKSAGLLVAMATGMVSVAFVLLVGAVEPAAEIDCRGVTAPVARSATPAAPGPASDAPTTSSDWNLWWPPHHRASSPTGGSATGVPTSGAQRSGVVTSSAEPAEVTGAEFPDECGSSVNRTAGASP
jgi:hypothetical protein